MEFDSRNAWAAASVVLVEKIDQIGNDSVKVLADLSAEVLSQPGLDETWLGDFFIHWKDVAKNFSSFDSECLAFERRVDEMAPLWKAAGPKGLVCIDVDGTVLNQTVMLTLQESILDFPAGTRNAALREERFKSYDYPANEAIVRIIRTLSEHRVPYRFLTSAPAEHTEPMMQARLNSLGLLGEPCEGLIHVAHKGERSDRWKPIEFESIEEVEGRQILATIGDQHSDHHFEWPDPRRFEVPPLKDPTKWSGD